MSADGVKELHEDGGIEVGLLILIFELHPEHLPAAELIRRMQTANPGEGDETEAVERALRRLQHSELVREANGVIVPTPAALHFDELPF